MRRQVVGRDGDVETVRGSGAGRAAREQQRAQQGT
jgi:hypothetical protein